MAEISEPLTATALSVIEDPRWVERAFRRLNAGSYYRFSRTPEVSGFNITSGAADLLPLWVYHKDITRHVRAAADPSVNLEEVRAKSAATTIMIGRQRSFFRTFTSSGAWKGESAIAGLVRDPAGTIKDATAAMRADTGLSPNVMILTYDVSRGVRDVLDNPPEIGLARHLGLEEVLIFPRTVSRTADGPYEWEMSGRALLLHRPSAAFANILVPAAGYRLTRDGLNDNGVRAVRIPIPTDDDPEAMRIEVDLSSVPVLVSPDLGHLFI